MRKGVLVSRVIYSIIIILILFNLYIKLSNEKLMLLPFLVCGGSLLMKNICLLIGKVEYLYIFNKIYIIGFFMFWFGFLIVWCYQSIINDEYLMLLFSIPFWLIGILFVRKKLL